MRALEVLRLLLVKLVLGVDRDQDKVLLEELGVLKGVFGHILRVLQVV